MVVSASDIHVCCTLQVESGPGELMDFVNLSDGRAMCWEFHEPIYAVVLGGLAVWEVFEEERFEGEGSV